MDLFKSSPSKLRFEAAQNTLHDLDWSKHFREHGRDTFSPANPLELGLSATITAIDYDPVQSLLAAGTADGHCHLWGSPAVYSSWQIRPSHSIKFLSFKPGSPLLCVIDIKNDLTVYNLSKIQDGLPLREYTHSVRSSVTCLQISPALSHMFLGLQDGTVDCFDLDHGIVAPYRIHNLWLKQEEIYRRSGARRASRTRRIPVCTDLKLHPFDLNLVLVAHEGGVSLYDLKQQLLIRSFELIIPPGAIGGNANPNDPSVFDERHPSVNCICFRPDGLVFAAGYSDGCVAFWSIDDGELPLLVRTVDRDNVFTFDWPDLLDDPNINAQPLEGRRGREAIFKMAWSHSPASRYDSSDQEHADDVIKNGTKLIILGGRLQDDPTGLDVFHLPGYQNSKTKAADGPNMNSRIVLKDSVTTVQHSVYPTNEIPDDFLLIPRKNPYFDRTEDPLAILISSTCSRRHDWIESEQFSDDSHAHFSSRTVHAYAFPPHVQEKPQEYLLPALFDWIGSKSVVLSQSFDLSDVAYQSLQLESKSRTSALPGMNHVPLRGGHARTSPLIVASLQEHFQQACRLITEFSQKHRILVTIHLDYKIRFWDLSLQLLLPNKRILSNIDSPHKLDHPHSTSAYDFDLQWEFPRRLDHLTVDLASLLKPSYNQLNLNKLALPIDVQLNSESLDLIVVLANKDCLVYQFHHQSVTNSDNTTDYSSILDDNPSTSLSLLNEANQPEGLPSESPDPASKRPLNQPEDKAVAPSQTGDILIDLLKFQESSVLPTGFLPTALIKLSGQGAVNSKIVSSHATDQVEVLYALEDMGFLAIAHPVEEWIKIIDLRKFKLLFDDVIRDENKSRRKNKENRIHCIRWIVARTESDPTALPRLLIGLSNGNFNIINLIPTDLDSIDNWTAAAAPGESFKNDHQKSASSPNSPIAVFTFGADGRPLLANVASVRNALSKFSRNRMVFPEEESDRSPSQASFDSILVAVFSQSVTVRMNINGPELLYKTDLSSEPIIHASTISHQSSYALLLVDRKRTCIILSLPKLELVSRSTLPLSDGDGAGTGRISIDQAGDVLEHSSLSTTQLTTLIYGRDSIHFPEIQVYDPSILAPEPPKAHDDSSRLSLLPASLASNLASWFNPHAQTGGGSGPGPSKVTGAELDRILAGPQRPSGKKVAPQPPRGNTKRPKGFMLAPKPSPKTGERHRESSSFREGSTMAGASGARNQLNHNVEALDERAERLNHLHERFDDLAQSTSEMVVEARRLAQQQAAKSAFSVGFSNVKSLFK